MVSFLLCVCGWIVIDTTLPFTEFDDPNIDKEAIILGQHSRVFVLAIVSDFGAQRMTRRTRRFDPPSPTRTTPRCLCPPSGPM